MPDFFRLRRRTCDTRQSIQKQNRSDGFNRVRPPVKIGHRAYEGLEAAAYLSVTICTQMNCAAKLAGAGIIFDGMP
jgi:hypothetical protein